MLKFLATLVLVDVDEREYQFQIKADNPKEAAAKVFSREDEILPRKPDVGDCVEVSNPSGAFTGFYIFDKNRKGKVVMREVSKPEFLVWRTTMKTNPTRKEGVDAALGRL
jgi:hypothetical protein